LKELFETHLVTPILIFTFFQNMRCRSTVLRMFLDGGEVSRKKRPEVERMKYTLSKSLEDKLRIIPVKNKQIVVSISRNYQSSTKKTRVDVYCSKLGDISYQNVKEVIQQQVGYYWNYNKIPEVKQLR